MIAIAFSFADAFPVRDIARRVNSSCSNRNLVTGDHVLFLQLFGDLQIVVPSHTISPDIGL